MRTRTSDEGAWSSRATTGSQLDFFTQGLNQKIRQKSPGQKVGLHCKVTFAP